MRAVTREYALELPPSHMRLACAAYSQSSQDKDEMPPRQATCKGASNLYLLSKGEIGLQLSGRVTPQNDLAEFRSNLAMKIRHF